MSSPESKLVAAFFVRPMDRWREEFTRGKGGNIHCFPRDSVSTQPTLASLRGARWKEFAPRTVGLINLSM
jgi:hypothetical protein